MHQEHRTVKNYLRAASSVQGIYVQTVALGIVIMAALVAYANRVLGEVTDALGSASSDSAIVTHLQERLAVASYINFFNFFLFIAFTIYLMIIFGQRVGGPTVAIRAFIKELRAGNYDAKRGLRDGDELSPIMDELKELATELKKRPSLLSADLRQP